MTDGWGTGRDSTWRDQCRRWTGNRNGRRDWQGVSLEGSRRPGPGWKGEGGRREEGHRVVCVCVGGGGGGRRIRTERVGVGPGGRSIATGLGRKPVGGCDSAEMRGPAIRSTAHEPNQTFHHMVWPMGGGSRGHGVVGGRGTGLVPEGG